MFRTPTTFRDPRVALFGLSLFSQANPGLESQLEMFARMLDATRNSLAVIRGEMKNFETSVKSVAQPSAEFTTKPVHEAPEELQPTSTYADTGYQQSMSNYQPVSTMQAADPISEARDRLSKFVEENPDRLQDFLDDLEELIQKYR